jgi:ATP-dependent RNA helicase SUPV3L1/SUV3
MSQHKTKNHHKTRIYRGRAAGGYHQPTNRDKRKAKRKAVIEAELYKHTPDAMIMEGAKLNRKFIVHVGSTNSGKTYDAVKALMEAGNGLYLGPLRLLALEQCDKINKAGIPCSLLTGEEHIDVPFSQITSSTVELANFSQHYKVVVIDECQLLADPSRGDRWMLALCMIDADVVHVCLAPEGLERVLGIIRRMSQDIQVVEHKRLSPLNYVGEISGLQEVQPGDALICFSRKSVLQVAAALKRLHIESSVIYGALPPAARREEVRRFEEGEATVAVATDAIGMGLSLHIKRIIFLETSKYDGKERRLLNIGEIKQIAGRAGRYGVEEVGEVLAYKKARDFGIIKMAMSFETPRADALRVPFPVEVLDTLPDSVEDILEVWNGMNKSGNFARADMSQPLALLKALKKVLDREPEDRRQLYSLISCPVDTKRDELVGYWANCAVAILFNCPIPPAEIDDSTLEGCEISYRMLDINHQMTTRAGAECDYDEIRAHLCDKIGEYLLATKSEYSPKCIRCGRKLPFLYPFNVCERCHAEQRRQRFNK